MKKEIGFIGLGRMGRNMSAHLVEEGYRVVGSDPDTQARSAAAASGVEVVEDTRALTKALDTPRTVWLMVPSEHVGAVLDELTEHVEAGDTVIDGGNSFYKDSCKRHTDLGEQGIRFLDCGTSGGVSGARHGASLMVGGAREVFEDQEHIFKALAAEEGYARVGAAGAGHFVKMVHNGIEYGMMGAIAEGMNVLKEHEEEFEIDLREVLKPYEHESIISSKLVTWLREAYDEGQIERVRGEVPRGETESEMEHIRTFTDVPVLSAALKQRKASRTCHTYTAKLIAAMRNQFGGHATIAQNEE